MLSYCIKIINTMEITIHKQKLTQGVEKKRKRSQDPPNISLKYLMKNKDQISKLKVDELKAFLREHKLPLSGTKHNLALRINTYIQDVKAVIKIQKTFRMHCVKYFKKILGKVSKDYVNDTDSITMEPISDIWKCRRISIGDNKGFNYMFDIISLIGIYKTNRKLNPYNRELMTEEQIMIMTAFAKLFNLLFRYTLDESECEQIDILMGLKFAGEYNMFYSHLGLKINNMPVCDNRTNNELTLNEQKTMVSSNLKHIREKTLQQRAIHLFMEMDMLGSYTDSKWFIDLTLEKYISYYKFLYNLWNLSTFIPRETKNIVYICGNPFNGVREIFHRNVAGVIERMTAMETCLFVMENLLYGSLDIENRKLGMMYLLMGLTHVSIPARMSMPWLFDVALL